MKAAVTGAGGMLGRALVPVLEGAGHRTQALTRAEADVTRIDDVRRAFQGFGPDWVFHLAAFTQVNECQSRKDHAFLVNASGSGHVAAAAAEVGAGVLMVSTDYVFGGGGPRSRPYGEDDPPAPLNVYGESKLAGERATREANPRHVIVRTAWLYGRGGRNFPDRILEQARAGRPLQVVNDQEGSPTWTEDLAPALLRLVDAGQAGIVHCTSRGSCTWYAFARHLVERAGLRVEIEAVASTSPHLPAVPRPAYSVLDQRRYETITGQRMPAWDDAVDRYLMSLRTGEPDTANKEGA